MNYPLRIADQLKPHLRALRKSRGLTQAQLGARVGVKQARIAEIEANPGAVSLGQLTQVLAALGATLHLHAFDASAAADRLDPAAAGRRTGGPTPPIKVPGTASSPRGAKPPSSPADQQRTTPRATATRVGVVIPAKKGTW